MQFRKFFPRMNNNIPNERDDNSILHIINVCGKEISTLRFCQSAACLSLFSLKNIPDITESHYL